MLALSATTGREQFKTVSVPNGGAAVVTAPTTAPTDVYVQFIAVKLAGSTGSYSASGYIIDGVLPPMRQASGAEVLLTTYTTDRGVTWRIRGILPGESIGDWTWTELQTLNATTYDGCLARVSGIVLDATGAGSARTVLMVANNGRWKYNSCAVRHRDQATAPAAMNGLSITTQVSVQFPAGLLQIGDTITLLYGMARTGATGNVTWRPYFGTTGVAATDTQLFTTNMTTTQLSSSAWLRFRVQSETSLELIGTGNTPSPNIGVNTVAQTAAVAVPDVNGTAVYISLATLVANAADTIQVTDFIVEHEMTV